MSVRSRERGLDTPGLWSSGPFLGDTPVRPVAGGTLGQDRDTPLPQWTVDASCSDAGLSCVLFSWANIAHYSQVLLSDVTLRHYVQRNFWHFSFCSRV